jgi:hypothetical protein
MKNRNILVVVAVAAFFMAAVTSCKDDDNKVAVTGVVLDKSMLPLTIGSDYPLEATVKPDNASNKNVTWESTDSGVVAVDANGKVSAKAEGTATITVTTEDGGKKAQCVVSVSKATVSVTGVTIAPSTVTLDEVGKTATLTATIAPANADNQLVTWAVEAGKEDVVTITSDGKVATVTAVGNGTAVITVTAAEGGGAHKANCTVTVDDPNDPDDPQMDNWTITATSVHENNVATNAIDGNRGTYWHSAVGSPYPQTVTVDMQAKKNIDGFTFFNRQENKEPARPKHIIIEISNDNENWEKVYENKEMSFALYEQILPLSDGRKQARYFRVSIITTWTPDEPYTYIGGVSIYTGNPPEANPAPANEWAATKATWIVRWSSRHVGMFGFALIDGDPNQPWHSGVGDAQPWAVIDMRKPYNITGIEFTHRKGGPGDVSSRPKHIIFSVSNATDVNIYEPSLENLKNGDMNWDVLYENTDLPNVNEMQTLMASTSKTGRYLKIEIIEKQDNQPYSYIGELDIIKN